MIIEIKKQEKFELEANVEDVLFIEILRNILISKEAIIIPTISKKKDKYSNIKILFKYKDIHIELNLDNLFEVKYLSKLYILDEKQVRLVAYLLKFKISHKIIKMFFSINCDFYKINLKENQLLEYSNIFEIYDLKLYKVIPQLKKTKEEVAIKKEVKIFDLLTECNKQFIACKKPKIKLIKTTNDFFNDIHSMNGIGLHNDIYSTNRIELHEKTNFGTLGQSIGVIENNFEVEFCESNNFNKYFKKRVKLKEVNNLNQEINSLVLWDIENINYFNDFSIISRFVKKDNQLKVVSFNEKFKIFNRNKIDFLLNKLKKRKWIINETNKIADNDLINTFKKYKDKINELVIISNDSDFKDILFEANNLNIKTIVIYRNNNKKHNNWYLNAKEVVNLNNF